MPTFFTKEAYLEGFQSTFEEAEKRASEDLKVYLNTQIQRLETLVSQICQENFWKLLPEILGIDAKMSLVVDLIDFDHCSDVEILRIVESEYSTYFKELCGYNRSMDPKHSMIFNVA
ncbi:hypothetical protein FDP51_02990 [Enterococcus mundtii]|uniref:DUF7006 family protein n=1 Tax=Enterococcus mundtii TaxID=53346 RepID=UPI00129CCCFA|nr:hypothetical protein [Enterococcus mundtii]MRI72995.1 hypothetical protein [Enterococcus mundtii]